MTGELMRLAITAMAIDGTLPTVSEENANSSQLTVSERNVLTDMRALRSGLESIDSGSGPFAKESEKKAEVMRTSVEKVEKAL